MAMPISEIREFDVLGDISEHRAFAMKTSMIDTGSDSGCARLGP